MAEQEARLLGIARDRVKGMKFPSLRAGRLLPAYDEKQHGSLLLHPRQQRLDFAAHQVRKCHASGQPLDLKELRDSEIPVIRASPQVRRGPLYASPLAPSRSTGRHSIIRRVLCVLLLLGRLLRFHKA